MYIEEKRGKLTSRYRISILLHEWVILLEIVLQSVKTPQGLFVQLLTFIGTCCLIQELFASGCSTLQN